jgi:hypothetical protein
MASMSDLLRRIETLEAQVAELVDRPSSKEQGTQQNPLRTVFLSSRDNPGAAKAVEIDPGKATRSAIETPEKALRS